MPIMTEESGRSYIGGERYQDTWNLDQVKKVHDDMMWTLNDIGARPPASVRVHSVNEGSMHEYGLDNFIQIQYDGNDHG